MYKLSTLYSHFLSCHGSSSTSSSYTSRVRASPSSEVEEALLLLVDAATLPRGCADGAEGARGALAGPLAAASCSEAGGGVTSAFLTVTLAEAPSTAALATTAPPSAGAAVTLATAVPT